MRDLELEVGDSGARSPRGKQATSLTSETWDKLTDESEAVRRTSEAGAPVGARAPSWLVRLRGLLCAGTLAVLTTGLFVFRSHGVKSATCSSVVLLWSEVLKVGSSLVMVLRAGNLRLARKSLLLACVPTCGYGVASMLAYWGMGYLDANTAALISQTKLPITALFSRVFLGRRISRARVFALVAILIGALGVLSYGVEQKAADAAGAGAGAADAGADFGAAADAEAVPAQLFLLAALAVFVVGILASSMAIFLQWVFTDFSTLWVRNLQFAALSVLFYAASHAVLDRGDECTTALDGVGVLVAVLQGAVGLFTALTLLWLGAIEKTLASVASLVLTCLAQDLFVQHAAPGAVQTTFVLAIVNGIVQFALET